MNKKGSGWVWFWTILIIIVVIISFSNYLNRRSYYHSVMRGASIYDYGELGPTHVCGYNYYNCDDFNTHLEAQKVYKECGGLNNDIHELDRDKDGSACDLLP